MGQIALQERLVLLGMLVIVGQLEQPSGAARADHVFFPKDDFVDAMGREIPLLEETGELFGGDFLGRQKIVDLLGAQGDMAIAREAADEGHERLGQTLGADGVGDVGDLLLGLGQACVVIHLQEAGERVGQPLPVQLDAQRP